MTTALATYRPLTPDVWTMIQMVAPTVKDSRLFGVATAEQAAAIMLKGHELGLGLTASFEFIHVIDSKPTLSPRGALALILNSPLLDKIEIRDETDQAGNPTGCSVMMARKGGLTYTARFTLEDAKRAGLMKSGSGWEKYPANMLRARAVGFCADMVFPDILNGMKRSDELGADLTPDGEVIEGSWSVKTSSQPAPAPVVQPAPVAPAQPDPVAWLNQLAQQYGAQAVIDANGGKIPATVEELGAAQAALAVSQSGGA